WTVDEKPHCGLRQSCSSGTYFAASSIRRFSASLLSSAARLLVTRPSTTRLLPLGTKRSGSNPPERASSYSRKKPSTASSPNNASATWSYPPSATQDERKLPRHICVQTVMPGGLPASA